MAGKKRERKAKPAKGKRQRAKPVPEPIKPPQEPAASPVPVPNQPPSSFTKFDTFLPDARKEKAAHLLADGKYAVEEIARDLGVTRQTIYNWKEEPDFAARIEEIKQEISQIALCALVGDKRYRLLTLQEHISALRQVMAERSAAPHLQNAPGGKTGVIVRQEKMIGSGESAQHVEEFVADLGILKEIRESMKQAAQELGQWVEKTAQTKADGTDTEPLSPEETLIALSNLAAAVGRRCQGPSVDGASDEVGSFLAEPGEPDGTSGDGT